MISREVATRSRCARDELARPRPACEVLLEQRPAAQTVMPGLWELPALRDADVPESELRMTVRHAIMQVNYYVRIRTVFEDDVDAMTVAGGKRRWVPLGEAGGHGADRSGPQGARPLASAADARTGHD